MQEKRLQNKKDFILVQRLIGTLSRMSVLTDFFKNRIIFSIFLLLYGILAILFFKCTMKLTKPNRIHE